MCRVLDKVYVFGRVSGIGIEALAGDIGMQRLVVVRLNEMELLILVAWGLGLGRVWVLVRMYLEVC